MKLTTHLHLVPRSKEWVELYLYSLNTPPWRGAQLKHRDNFTFTFRLLFIGFTVETLFATVLGLINASNKRTHLSYGNSASVFRHRHDQNSALNYVCDRLKPIPSSFPSLIQSSTYLVPIVMSQWAAGQRISLCFSSTTFTLVGTYRALHVNSTMTHRAVSKYMTRYNLKVTEVTTYFSILHNEELRHL
jgi:hypothetical protein